jgi:hypothetical protein
MCQLGKESKNICSDNYWEAQKDPRHWQYMNACCHSLKIDLKFYIYTSILYLYSSWGDSEFVVLPRLKMITT